MPQYDSNALLLEWLTFKRLKISSIDKVVDQLELSCTTGTNVKGYKNFRRLAFPVELSIYLPCDTQFHS